MRIILIAAAFLLLKTVPPVPRQAANNSGPDSEKQQGKSPTNGPASGNSKSANNQSHSPKPEQSGQQLAPVEVRISPVHVHKDWADYLYIWQSMVLSFAALLTLGAIWYQARETARAANAARDSVAEIKRQSDIQAAGMGQL